MILKCLNVAKTLERFHPPTCTKRIMTLTPNQRHHNIRIIDLLIGLCILEKTKQKQTNKIKDNFLKIVVCSFLVSHCNFSVSITLVLIILTFSTI